MLFTGIAHMALRCRDLDHSLAFYTEELGFPEMFRLNDDEGHLWLVYLRITDTVYLELFPEAEGERSPGKMQVGWNHLCLETGDIDAVKAHMEEKAIPLFRPLTTGKDGNRQLWIEDPDGNRIEIMEMAADSLQAQAIAQMSANYLS